MSNDDIYLVKLLGAKFKIPVIAAKMGMTVEQVEQRLKQIREKTIVEQASGYLALCNQFTVMAHQYQLLGESMKIISRALANQMDSSELKALITADPEQTLENLTKSCIILKPFIGVDPEKSLQEHLKSIQKSN